MQQLERIVWPRVEQGIRQMIDEIQRDTSGTLESSGKRPIVVVEAAVLLDAEWYMSIRMDGVWAVSVPREVALKRLQETRGWTIEEATLRLDAQQDQRRGIGEKNLQKEVDRKVVTAVVVNTEDPGNLPATLFSMLDDPLSWYPYKENKR